MELKPELEPVQTRPLQTGELTALGPQYNPRLAIQQLARVSFLPNTYPVATEVTETQSSNRNAYDAIFDILSIIVNLEKRTLWGTKYQWVISTPISPPLVF